MIYHLVGVCDSFDICKQYIKKELAKQKVINPAFDRMTKENNYTLIMPRKDIDKSFIYGSGHDGYIIEELMLNEFGDRYNWS